jgi:ATP-dependent protease HslVU (ClpYQ) peptidase subunit
VTTVAFSRIGGEVTLAADRQSYGTYKTRSRKLWRLRNGILFAGAGVIEQILAVRDWLEDETQTKPDGLSEFTGILIDPNGTAFRLEEKCIRDPILERFHAVGSGAPFAVTAMWLGKTAREAVLIAARFDPRTGGGVDTLIL